MIFYILYKLHNSYFVKIVICVMFVVFIIIIFIFIYITRVGLLHVYIIYTYDHLIRPTFTNTLNEHLVTNTLLRTPFYEYLFTNTMRGALTVATAPPHGAPRREVCLKPSVKGGRKGVRNSGRNGDRNKLIYTYIYIYISI